MLMGTSESAIASSFNVGDTISFTWNVATSVYVPSENGYGGVFTITDINNGAVFKTFCLELNENIVNGNIVDSISNAAVNGGVGGQTASNYDPISSSTDWLMAQYAMGIQGYTDPQALQMAFWILEDEVSIAQNETGAYISRDVIYWIENYGEKFNIAKGYISAATAATQNGGSYGSQVLNLKSNDGTKAQSQLFHSVPEPTQMLLFGTALIGLAGVGRKRFLKK
jgi:hypothetical protein